MLIMSCSTVMLLLWVLIVFCMLKLSSSLVTLPTIGHLHYCKDMLTFQQLMLQARTADVVVVGILTYDLTQDSYSSIYLGRILDLFDIPELSVNTVVLQQPQGLTLLEAGAKMIQLLPPRSIFVSYEHGFSSFGMKYLDELKRLGFGPRVIYHVNHERPWNTKDTKDMNYIYKTTDDLIASYSLHPLVLRNYYYEPLLKYSYYLPLGPSYYSYWLGNPKSNYSQAYLKPPSQRSTRCYFKGRLNYFTKLENNTILHTDKEELHIRQRIQLLELASHGHAGGCIAESSDNDQQQLNNEEFYRLYVDKLADTVFALCPAGNNPETFRHYEALELGAIPILIRPLPEQDFLKYDLWSTYPGPILSDWSELDSYLNSMSIEKTDALQLQVISWYQEFKKQTKQRLTNVLLKIFEGVSNNPEIVNHNSQQAINERGEATLYFDRAISNVWQQMENLHHRLTVVEAELSASIQREQQLIALLREKKIID